MILTNIQDTKGVNTKMAKKTVMKETSKKEIKRDAGAKEMKIESKEMPKMKGKKC